MRLDAWKNLQQAGDDYVTVALDTTRDGPGAAHRIELRWEAARDELAAAGVPDRLLELIGDRFAVVDGRTGPVGRCVIAAVGDDGDAARIVLDVPLPEAPDGIADRGPVPNLLPLLRSGQRYPAHLHVNIDRTGADISVRGPLGADAGEHEVSGDHDVIHKVSAGEASEQRLQRRAEDSWERNATEVAHQVDRLAQQHHPAVITVAGDTRAVTALHAHVNERVAALLTVLDTGGRADGTDQEAQEAAIRDALDAAVATDVEQTTAQLLQAEGRQDRAAQGPDEVTRAFDRGQVETLVLTDPPPDTRRAVELAAAALRTDAAVVLVPAEVTLPGGVAAVLRWADGATPHDSGPSMPGHGEQPGWQP